MRGGESLALLQPPPPNKMVASSNAASPPAMVFGFARFASEACVCGLLLVYVLATIRLQPLATQFMERDPTISFSLQLETVPTSMLVGLCVGIPVAVILIGHGARYAVMSASAKPGWSPLLASLAWTLLSLAQALVFSMALVDTVKNVVGRQRPNFFALCDYAGYRAAAASDNFTAYDATTVPGVFGSVSRCAAAAADVADSQRSFPSGHSSLSAAAMTWTTLYLRLASGVSPSSHFNVRAMLCNAPLVLAAWVCVTRMRDRFHNADDVMAGALFGVGCAWCAWLHYVRHHRYASVMPAAQGLEADKVGGTSSSGGAIGDRYVDIGGMAPAAAVAVAVAPEPRQ